VVLTLYTKPGCHLCESMKALLATAKAQQPFELTVIDISNNPALKRLYQNHIPVLLKDGKEIARHRIDDTELSALLSSR